MDLGREFNVDDNLVGKSSDLVMKEAGCYKNWRQLIKTKRSVRQVSLNTIIDARSLLFLPTVDSIWSSCRIEKQL